MASCHTPSYTFTRNSSNSFNPVPGKYLLNYIDAPEAVRSEFQEKLLEKFPPNTIPAENAPVSIIPGKIPENPDRTFLERLSRSTGNFDYFINVAAGISSDDIDSMQIGNLDPSSRNETYVVVEVFDLKNPGSVFYSRLKATLQERDDNQDFSFAVDSNTMLKRSLKKILKRINTPG